MEDGAEEVVSKCEVVFASLCKLVSSSSLVSNSFHDDAEEQEQEQEENRSHHLEKNLLFLIAFARSSDGRQKLAEVNAIPVLLPLLPEFASFFSFASHQFHVFLLFLKLLRNLCAGNGINQDLFVQCKGLDTLASIAHSLLSSSSSSKECLPEVRSEMDHSLETSTTLRSRGGSLESSPSTWRDLPPPHAVEALQMLLQVAGNVAGRGELNQAAVWESFFPAIFRGTAHVMSDKVQELLCMVLYTCCKGSENLCMEIVNSQGVPIIASILIADTSYSGSVAARNEWLERLITHLCLVEKQCFPLLYTELGVPCNTVSSAAMQYLPHPEAPLRHKLETSLPSKEQASLLEILCVWIEENGGRGREETVEGGGDRLTPLGPLLPMECAGFLVDVIRHAAQCAASNGLCAPAFPTNLPVLDVLGLSLSIARIHCAWDKTVISAREPNSETATMAAKLASNGLIALMLDMLRALRPPQSARPGVPPENSSNNSDLQQSSSLELPRATVSVGNDSAETDGASPNKNVSIEDMQASSSNFGESFPTRDPYKGYRRDIVAVIANASYRNFHIQEEVRETDGLYLVLEQCTTDINNPFLREWGLWAIRNLLEGNPRNQREFADLEAKATIANPELRDVGISVELNPETGRPRLVNVPNTERNH